MRAVPHDLLLKGMETTANYASYVIEEKVIAPGHTLGNPNAPLHARIGKTDWDHWEGAPVLELVDVDRSGQPVPIGVERGLRLMRWA